jgi:hypothetical protein
MNLKSFLPTLPLGFNNLFRGMVSPRSEGGSTFYFMRGATVELPFKTGFEMAQGIPHLGAVIDKGSEMFSAVSFKVVRTDTKEEEVDYKHRLNVVLKSPNKMQTWKQLLYMSYTYKILSGAAFLFPGFGISKTPSNLAYLSAIDFDSYTKRTNYNVRSIENPDPDELIDAIDFYFKYSPSVSLKPSELMWIKDRFSNYVDDYSRITSLEKNLENIYKVLVARGILIDKKGGIGMIAGNQKDSGMSVPLRPREKKKLENAVNDHNLGAMGKSIMVTDVPLRYTPFVFPTRELMLFEEIEDDFNTICDRCGIARELFDAQTTFANKKMAETSTYINTIAPAWKDFFEVLNKTLNTSAEKIRIDPVFTHVEALQRNEYEKNQAEQLKSTVLLQELDRNIIDINEYRQQMGYAAKPEAEEVDAPASTKEQAALRGSVGGVQGILAVQASVSNGTTSRDAALSIFTIIYGFTSDQANDLLGDPEEITVALPQNGQKKKRLLI